MKLSKRINLIILPILIVIFTVAGFVAYFSQKAIVLQSLRDKLEYQTGQVIDNLNTELVETESLLKQFLNSVEVANYLVKEQSSYESYSAEGYLTRFISSVNKSTGKSIQLRIADSTGKLLFYFDSTDPFFRCQRKYITTCTPELHRKSIKFPILVDSRHYHLQSRAR